MDKEFSKYLESKHDLIKQIIDKLKEKYEYASCLASDCVGQKIITTNNSVEIKDSMWNEQGYVFRVYKDKSFFEYSTNIIENVDDIVSKIEKSENIESKLGKSIYVKPQNNQLYKEEIITKSYSRMDLYEDLDEDYIINKSKEAIENAMDNYEYIIQASIMIEYLKISKMFISTNKDLKQVYAWACGKYQCIVNRDDTTKFDYIGISDISLKSLFNKVLSRVDEISSEATMLLDATKIEPGIYDCITTSEITGLIAHEAFGHGVEMDMFVKNRAMGKDFLGKTVGSNLVNMHEGAKPYNDVSSYFFDDEGVEAHDTIEIKDGILLTGVSDILSATKLNTSPTGNGKRENYKHKAYSRMTSTYFEKGTSKLEDMIKSIKYGYLIDRELSGMEDPKNWGIQCIALIGKEIKDGKLTGKIVSPLIITGNVIDLLSSITMVSDDFELVGSGACGKGYKEFVKTSIGGACLKGRIQLG